MKRNIEIKARIQEGLEVLISRVAALADQGPSELHQDDVFFSCPNGRLKLRSFSPSEGQLIFYQRKGGAEPKESQYVIAEISSPETMREVLKMAYGEVGRVQNVRQLFMVGRTRIHIDLVLDLGSFIELEVVLADGEPVEVGLAEAHGLLEKLGLSPQQLVSEAYVDMFA